MRKKYPVLLTADELSNVTTALEHFLEYLEDHGRTDYGDDLPEIVESFQSSLDAVNDAAYKGIVRPT